MILKKNKIIRMIYNLKYPKFKILFIKKIHKKIRKKTIRD